nr:MAG TPA: protein of unknown function (DUF5524) [Caudoviricetes sp.]
MFSKLLSFGYQNLKGSKKKNFFLEISTIVVDFLF